MVKATLQEEKKLWKKGYKKVAGLDEAGRGPLAGPVTAGAVTIIGRSDLPIFKNFRRSDLLNIDLHDIKDSKQLSPKKREEFYKIITRHPAIKWGVGRVSEKVIDKINILEATKLAMKKAIKNLGPKLMEVGPPLKYREVRPPRIDFLILDGKMKLDLPIPQKSIVKGDEKVFSCAAASIIAKVYRDRIMRKYHRKYPSYGFDKHKGYPTKYHYRMIRKHGPCQIHRKSFILYKYGGVPKQRKTKSRQKQRRMHLFLKRRSSTSCPKCSKPILPHTLCRNCGCYKGKEFIDVMKKLTKKEKKQKEREMRGKEEQEKGENKKEGGLSWEEMSKK